MQTKITTSFFLNGCRRMHQNVMLHPLKHLKWKAKCYHQFSCEKYFDCQTKLCNRKGKWCTRCVRCHDSTKWHQIALSLQLDSQCSMCPYPYICVHRSNWILCIKWLYKVFALNYLLSLTLYTNLCEYIALIIRG